MSARKEPVCAHEWASPDVVAGTFLNGGLPDPTLVASAANAIALAKRGNR